VLLKRTDVGRLKRRETATWGGLIIKKNSRGGGKARSRPVGGTVEREGGILNGFEKKKTIRKGTKSHLGKKRRILELIKKGKDLEEKTGGKRGRRGSVTGPKKDPQGELMGGGGRFGKKKKKKKESQT